MPGPLAIAGGALLAGSLLAAPTGAHYERVLDDELARGYTDDELEEFRQGARLAFTLGYEDA